ncbi:MULTISPECIES: hypothetical protein [Streptomyces]|uniref:hypothetical protein n=1 Tax=Streptomyces TaxID=1883 RepID=UPI0023DD0293|nr:hypothetical protein [Streptomyces sp. FXJ1.172]WEP00539.1 hypothetical protein A6P39_043130 [Streptomyces sp. FXJ1.172]
MLKMRIASVAILAGAALAAVTTGAQASTATDTNSLIKEHISWSSCQFWASAYNGASGEQQGVTSTYFYCANGGNGTANLWHKNY